MPEDPEQENSLPEKPSTDKLSAKKEEEIVEESRKRLDMCEEAERGLREKALDDLHFRAGEQWDREVKRRREARKKPCLTINPIPAREHQITNEYRQNRSWIQVNPVDDQADDDTAQVLGGIIRHIEYDSDVDDAQDTGLISAVRCGFGFMRLRTEFESPTSFQQVVKVDRIRNPFQVYLDCAASKADRSDAKYGFIYETLTKEEYEEEYPGHTWAELNTAAPGTRDPDWISKDGIRIAEYYRTETTKHTLYLMQVGNVAPIAVLDDDLDKLLDSVPRKLRKTLKKVDERETSVPAIHWYKHNAREVLDHEAWAGKWVPIIPILGDELDVDGELILEGIVRHAKDPIRVYNSMASAQVEAIWLAPKAPWVVDAKSIAQYKRMWESSNTENWAYLPYDSTDAQNAGKNYPEPKREAIEPPIMAITSAKMQAADDIRTTTGIHEAQMGQASNEKSGKAITARKMQGELSNYHFIDNMSRARRFLGRQLLDLIPKVYSMATMVRSIGEDGAQKVVKVNQKFKQGDGSLKSYDLGTGRYDVTISNQPSYQTRRQEQADTLTSLSAANPQLFAVASDLMVGAMDLPQHEKLAQRLKKVIELQFPGIVEEDGDSDPKMKLQQTQMQLQAMSQQQQQLTTALNHEIKLREEKQVEQDAKLQMVRETEASRREIALMQEETKRLGMENQRQIAEITTKAQDARERLKLDADLDTKMRVQAGAQTHQSDMAEAEFQRKAAMQRDQQAQEKEMQQGQQGFEADQAAGDQDFQREQTAGAQSHESDMADKQAAISADSQAADQAHEQTMAEQAAAQAAAQAKAKGATAGQ